VRRLGLLLTILITLSACGAASRPPSARAGAATAAARSGGSTPPCRQALRRISARGRGGARPQVAGGADAFAVAWEETTDHRAIRVATFSDDGQPIGGSIEVADLVRSGAEPRVIADGAQFLVLWTAEQGDSSVIDVRHLDRAGKPLGDIVPIVSAAGARVLAAVALPDGYAVAWWNWSGTPHQVAVSFFDHKDRPLGRVVPVTRAPSPDPTVDFAARPGGGLTVGWEEMVDGVQHVLVGELARAQLTGRIDLGIGESPELGTGVVVWQRPAESTLWWAPVDGAGAAAAARLTDGHTPAVAIRGDGTNAVCFVRDTSADDSRADELWCGDLSSGKLTTPTRVTVEDRGILGVQAAAAAGRLGVTWQAQEEDDTGVAFAQVSCAAGASGQARR
jgi:hypothetical protein